MIIKSEIVINLFVLYLSTELFALANLGNKALENAPGIILSREIISDGAV